MHLMFLNIKAHQKIAKEEDNEENSKLLKG